MYAYSTFFLPLPHRKVHISQATLAALHGSYVVEPGAGASRNTYLEERGVETYFIVSRIPDVSVILCELEVKNKT